MYFINILNSDNQTVEKLMNMSEAEAKYSAESLRRRGENFKVYNYDFEEVGF